eukprot:SM002354S08022  [mRNA]  locus=s2354:217:662:- [translate_table: standard]
MRLAVSLQRSMARALHLRAGRALAAAGRITGGWEKNCKAWAMDRR